MSILAYERDPYLLTLETKVVSTGTADGRPFAVLDDTIFYPEGGGQPADHGHLHGHLGDVTVFDVQKVAGEVRHLLERAVEIDAVELRLDWARRYDHMQQHTAQHLLTAIAADRFGWPTTSFHLREEVCDIELDVGKISAGRLAELEEAVAVEIRSDHALATRRVNAGEAAEQGRLRSRGLPEGYTGDVRLVEIPGIDLNTCGGTHLRSTGEIESLKLLATEAIRGGTRLHWVAGARVRRRLGQHEARNAELRQTLGAADDDLVEIARGKIEQLKSAQRREKALGSQLAEARAESLAHRAADGTTAEAHFEGADAGFLQLVARQFQGAAPRGAALLTAESEKGAFFALTAGQESPLDVATAGRRVAEALGGRGGGSGKIFQGKAPSLLGRDAAVAAVTENAA